MQSRIASHRSLQRATLNRWLWQSLNPPVPTHTQGAGGPAEALQAGLGEAAPADLPRQPHPGAVQPRRVRESEGLPAFMHPHVSARPQSVVQPQRV